MTMSKYIPAATICTCILLLTAPVTQAGPGGGRVKPEPPQPRGERETTDTPSSTSAQPPITIYVPFKRGALIRTTIQHRHGRDGAVAKSGGKTADLQKVSVKLEEAGLLDCTGGHAVIHTFQCCEPFPDAEHCLDSGLPICTD
jgi:hypothetical protein